jgi:hypothetical protein
MPTNARQQRQLTRATATVDRWWHSVPDDDRLPYYTPATIERATGTPLQELAAALRAGGWQRQQVRIAGTATVVWVAPGAPSPLRPRGRPRKTPTPLTYRGGSTP